MLDMDWVDLAEDIDMWQAFMNVITNFQAL
jgi:hypothetical protein